MTAYPFKIIQAVLLALAVGSTAFAQAPFVRSDFNADGDIDVSDAVGELLVLFAGKPSPGCDKAGDSNDDGALNITDATSLLGYLFRGSAQPPAPFPGCGQDPTADELTCLAYARCGADGDPEITEWTVPWSGTRPRGPYVDDQGRVWFVGQTGDYVAYLEPASGDFTRFDLDSGAGPHNVIVDDFAWYSGNLDAHIGRVDRETGEIEVIPMPDPAASDPHTLVFDRAGNIWFTVQSGNFVGKLVKSSLEVVLRKVPTSSSRPYGIAMDPSDQPWFVEFGTNKLATINAATLEIREVVLPASGARPRRLGITSDGAVWYADYSRGRLGRYVPSTSQHKDWLLPGGTGSRPYGMAVDDRDRIWLVETGSQPNRFVGFQPASETFFSNVQIPSGGGSVRHMYFHPPTREIWFGTDAGTIGRAKV